jgi:DNA-binding MurR/RpiR family transcriptional regulator
MILAKIPRHAKKVSKQTKQVAKYITKSWESSLFQKSWE